MLGSCTCIPVRTLWTWYSGIGQSGPGGSTLYSKMNVLDIALRLYLISDNKLHFCVLHVDQFWFNFVSKYMCMYKYMCEYIICQIESLVHCEITTDQIEIL